MWKRKKEITGVSNASILSLKSIVASEEREIKTLVEEGVMKPKKIGKLNLLDNVHSKKRAEGEGESNQGLAERRARDDLAIEAEEQTEESRLKNMLEKAKRYHQLAAQDLFAGVPEDMDRGDSSLVYRVESEDHTIDFKEKSYSAHQEREQQKTPGSDDLRNRAMSETDYMKQLWEDQREEETYEKEEEDEEEKEERLRKETKIEEVRKLSEETRLEREKLAREKESSKRVVEDRQDQINKLKKAALLKKQLLEQQQKNKK